MPDLPYHFNIEGPRRDYDYATFCKNAWNEAMRFAQDWIEDVADQLDPGEDFSLKFGVVAGSGDLCCGIDAHECLAERNVNTVTEDDPDA